MDKIISDVHGFNYLEIYFTNKQSTPGIHDDLQSYDIQLGKDLFQTMLSSMKSTDFKFFQKEYKEYTHKDLTCQSYTNDEVKVYRKTPVNVETIDHKIFVTSMRQKLTLLNFPSTTDLQQVTYVKKLIFRVSNRIYVNFEITMNNVTKQKVYTVYINYNHEENVDAMLINQTLYKVLQILTPQAPIC
jgi:hypothetical protein